MSIRPQQSTDGFALRIALFYGGLFLFGGIQLPFFPVWLEAKGLDARLIGWVIAVPTLVRILVVPLISHHADQKGALKATLVMVSVWGAMALALLAFADGAPAILAIYALAAIGFTPMLTLADAYALSGLALRGRAYGPVRLWGSVTFIVGNLAVGMLLGQIAPVLLIWPLAGALAISAVAAAALRPIATYHAEAVPRRRPVELLKIPGFAAVTAAAALIQASHALYIGFSTLAWRDAGIGGTSIGALWALGVVAEIVLFAASARFPTLSPAWLLGIGAVGGIVRWSAMVADPPMAVLVVLQTLHAATFGATHLGTMAYLARAVPRELAATAQGAVSSVSAIILAVATALSGYLYEDAGSSAYAAMAAMAAAGLLCAISAGRNWRG